MARLASAVLTVGEVFALFRSISHARDALMFRVMYATGMRQAELVRFCPADVDFGRGTLFVRRAGQSADRYLPLDDLTLELLGRWMEGLPAGQPVFPLVPRHVYTRLRLWTDACGLTAHYLAQGRRVSPHTLRLSSFAHCRAAGMSASSLRFYEGGEWEPCEEWAEEVGSPSELPVLACDEVEPFLYHSGVRWSELPAVVLEDGLVRLPDRVVPVPAGLVVPTSFSGTSWRHAAVGRAFGPEALRQLRAVHWLEEGRPVAEVGRLLGLREAATARRFLRCACRLWREEWLACHPLGLHV